MSCCTWIRESEKNQPIQNKHVAEWLANARKATGIEWVVLERAFYVTKWFRTKQIWRYEILNPICEDHLEYQCMNFYRDGTDWTINMLVPAEIAVAYLMGLCGRNK
jgi:hypothetical protein